LNKLDCFTIPVYETVEMDVMVTTSEVGSVGAEGAAAGLTALEVEVIDLFVAGTRLLGLPRSLGEIYGLLFLSPEGLTIDQMVTRLRISKGSVSQGLKTLRMLGAVKVTYVAGDRRDHYGAETDLKSLVSGFISGQMVPHLETGEVRLARLRELEAAAGETLDAARRARLEKLAYWHHRARTLAPLAGRFLDFQ
jgi:HTH-type transcriptional regulator, glycine betaine synthesis regulator